MMHVCFIILRKRAEQMKGMIWYLIIFLRVFMAPHQGNIENAMGKDMKCHGSMGIVLRVFERPGQHQEYYQVQRNFAWIIVWACNVQTAHPVLV